MTTRSHLLRRTASLTLAGSALLLAAGCTPGARPEAAVSGSTLSFDDIARARRTRDYFTLREQLRSARAKGESGLAMEIGGALAQYAFNQPRPSNAALARVFQAGGIPDSLRTWLREIALDNHLRLFEYPAGLAAADALLADSARLDMETMRDARNVRRILQALARTPPQTVVVHGATRVPLTGGRIPVTIGDSSRQYVFDTGANLSTMMRSEATSLGLTILPAGIDVGTSTALRVTADLAVAPLLRVGAMEFRNVVFLVLDDAMLTFGNFRIPGILGFPVIDQMGEVHLVRGQELLVPERPPRRTQENLALSGLTPLIRAEWEHRPLLCRLDTGANSTDFYELFYRRFTTFVDSAGRAAMRRVGGAGGISETPVRVIPSLRLALGDTIARADSVDVLVQRITRTDAENYLDCNVGTDVLGQFATLILNFRDMAFLLR